MVFLQVDWKLDGLVLPDNSSYEMVSEGYTTMLKVLNPTKDTNFTCSFVYSRVSFEETVLLEFIPQTLPPIEPTTKGTVNPIGSSWDLDSVKMREVSCEESFTCLEQCSAAFHRYF